MSQPISDYYKYHNVQSESNQHAFSIIFLHFLPHFWCLGLEGKSHGLIKYILKSLLGQSTAFEIFGLAFFFYDLPCNLFADGLLLGVFYFLLIFLT